MGALLYPVLSAALYYLGCRAQITAWLWSRYPPRLDRFMLCAACSGTWFGFALAAGLGYPLKIPFAGLTGAAWYTPFIVGGVTLWTTPLLAVVHIKALEVLEGKGDKP